MDAGLICVVMEGDMSKHSDMDVGLGSAIREDG